MTGQGYRNLSDIQTQSGAATAAGYLGQGQAAASNYLTQGNIWSSTLNQGLNAYALWQMGGLGGSGSAGLSNAGPAAASLAAGY
jgi:hypothetical protein